MLFDPMDLVIVTGVGIGVLLLSSVLRFVVRHFVEQYLDRRNARRAKEARDPWAS